MGLLKRCWHQGDRRCFYRTADNLAEVFREGIVSVLRRKLEQAGGELNQALVQMEGAGGASSRTSFLLNRIKRARLLGDRANRLLNSRIVRYFIR